MVRDEADACLEILMAVALADGTVTADEKRALAILADADASIDTRQRPIDVVALARRIRSPDARRVTFEAAVALAHVDSSLSLEEHELLRTLRDALGVDDASDLELVESGWRERLNTPLRTLASADADFLRSLARERAENGLSTEKYAALVDELRRTHVRVLEEALGARPS